jgi:hypothetical protein
MKAEPLAVQHIAEAEASTELSWLVEDLWLEQGVGFLGGHPKTGKSWLALDIALSVASRTPVAGHWSVPRGGGVLVFAAEDSPPMVRARFRGLAAARQVALEDVPIHLVLESSLRLESSTDQARLVATVELLRPALLVLDPFVRMTGIDENSAQEVSRVLAFLRELQRSHAVAILVVHHVRKSAGGGNGGLALRGSGDFWAWSDTNLYLARKQAGIELAIEQRSALAPDPILLQLCNEEPHGPHLRTCDHDPQPSDGEPLASRVLAHLEDEGGPCKLDAIRAALRVRMQSVVNMLRELAHDGRVRRVDGGWQAKPPDSPREPGETEAGSAEAQPAQG